MPKVRQPSEFYQPPNPVSLSVVGQIADGPLYRNTLYYPASAGALSFGGAYLTSLLMSVDLGSIVAALLAFQMASKFSTITKLWAVSSAAEHRSYTPGAVGSNPTPPTSNHTGSVSLPYDRKSHLSAS
jgi:hypothetical protein